MSIQLTAREQLDITAIKLNKVYFQSIAEEQSHPGLATVKSPIFKEMTTNLAAYYQDTYGGVGYFTSTNETDSNFYDRTDVRNQLTVLLNEYTKNVKMSKMYFETADQLHPVLKESMANISRNAFKTQNLTGFGLFRGGFSTTRTADGSFWFGTHNLIKGGTETNGYSNATIPGGDSTLTPANINFALRRLLEQKDQAGVLGGYVGRYLVVPPSLFSRANEICKAVLVANSNNNNYNMIGQEYPLEIYQSPFLGSAAGGSDTAWFILSTQHSVTRLVRKEMETRVVPWEYDDNNEYKIKSYYSESYFVSDYSGTIGFLGA